MLDLVFVLGICAVFALIGVLANAVAALIPSAKALSTEPVPAQSSTEGVHDDRF